MHMGIGEQLKGMVRRARNYWAELTDEDRHHREQIQQETEEIHQSYGGTQDQPGNASGMESARVAGSRPPRPRQSQSQSQRGPQMGEYSPGANEPQADSQTQRQYTQQGGRGIQKTLEEQLGKQPGDEEPGTATEHSVPGPEQHH